MTLPVGICQDSDSVLHRCRRGHAQDNGHCFRSTAAGQRDMTGTRSRSESANGRHDLNRSGGCSVAGGNGQPGLVGERPCPGVRDVTLAGARLDVPTFAVQLKPIGLTDNMEVATGAGLGDSRTIPMSRRPPRRLSRWSMWGAGKSGSLPRSIHQPIHRLRTSA